MAKAKLIYSDRFVVRFHVERITTVTEDDGYSAPKSAEDSKAEIAKFVVENASLVTAFEEMIKILDALRVAHTTRELDKE